MSTDQNHLDTEQLSALAAGEQLSSESVAHVAGCPSCRKELRSWQTIAEATRIWSSADASEPDRVLSSLLAEVERLPRSADAAFNDGSLRRPRRRATAGSFGRHRGRWLALAVAVVVVALTVPLVTVGGRSTARPSVAYVLSRFAVASAITKRTGTVHVVETIRHDRLNPLPNEDISGDVQPATGVQKDVVTSPSWPAGAKVTVLILTSTGYAKATAPSPLFGVGEWLSGPLGLIANPEPIPPGSLGQLAGVEGPVSALGHRTIAGKAVTGYRATINVGALIREAKNSSLRSYYQYEYVKQRIASFPINVWLDNQGRLREVSYQLHYWFQPKDRPAEVTQSYSYRDSVLSLGPPPADQTTKVASYNDAVDQALGQVEASLAFAKTHLHS